MRITRKHVGKRLRLENHSQTPTGTKTTVIVARLVGVSSVGPTAMVEDSPYESLRPLPVSEWRITEVLYE